MNKIAIIKVKVTLPANFKPRTVTYRAFSQFEKENEKNYVIQRAEELFVKHILEKGKEWKLDKSQLKVKSTIMMYNVRCYIPTINRWAPPVENIMMYNVRYCIPTENEIAVRYEKDSNNSKIKKMGVLSISDAILNQKYDLVSEVFVHIGIFRVRSHACEKGFSIFSSDLLFRGLTGNYI